MKVPATAACPDPEATGSPTPPFRSRQPILCCALAAGMGLLALPQSRVCAEEAPSPVPPPSGLAASHDNPPTSWATDRFAAGFQSTYIWQKKPHFGALYSGPNSLGEASASGNTLTATLFLDARLWRAAEAWVNPEVIQSIAFSNLRGLGGLGNSENQKGGGPNPTLYLARAFIRQSIPLGGESLGLDAGPNQFAATVSRRRLVLTVGNLSVLDVFDPDPYARDGRTEFFNWALFTHGAFDYVADARGYTWGVAVEYDHDNWAVRVGRFLGPKQSNGLALDYNIFAHYGDNIEVEHSHSLRGRPGKVRVLGYRNYERMGAFTEAVAFAAANGGTPDVGPVRRDQAKYGFGVAIDQAITRDAGAFLRGSWHDGRTETYSFAEIDRSLAAGATMHGPLWRRPGDTLGAAWVVNGLSSPHRDYVARGGLGFFIGDGAINYQAEQIIEVYYSAATFHGLWVSLDYQHIWNPAYNADRGPVDFFGTRLHLEL